MKDPRFGKVVIFVNALVPLAMLCFDAWHRRLGANPIDFAIHTTGMLAIIFLMLSLAVTPLRKITGQNWLAHFRKLLGLIAFFYACLHFLGYALFNFRFNIRSIVADTFQHQFIFFGMACFLVLIPLAVTSTKGMVKRIGGKNWQRLHRLAYAAGVLAVIHFWMFVKADLTLPITFAVIVTILLGIRLVFTLLKSTSPTKQRGFPVKPI